MSQDPLDLERTDEKPKSQYVSRRDVKVSSIGIIILALLLSPVYFVLKDRSDAYICKRNFQSMAKAISLYAAENNERLPPAFVTMDGTTPFVEKDGGLYTWAYLISPYMRTGASFKCPKADVEECYMDHDSESGKLIPVSYGMYLPMSSMPISSISDPGASILITETISFGKSDVFNPHPILDVDGKPVADGFIVTWDTGNQVSDAKVSAVTRLAYRDSKSGTFVKSGPTRHPEGNHFLTVAGTAISLPPTAARVDWDSKRNKIIGRWAIPE